MLHIPIVLPKSPETGFIGTPVYRASSSSVIANPQSLILSLDGTKLYMCSSSSDSVLYQYSMSVPFDITTLVFEKSKDLTEVDNLQSFFIDSTGTIIIVHSYLLNGRTMKKYTMSTPYDIATASYQNTSPILNMQDYPKGYFIRDDGIRLLNISSSKDRLDSFDLPSIWNVQDIPSYSFRDTGIDITSYVSSPGSVWFSKNGLKFWLCGSSPDYIQEFSLSVAWDILSTVTHIQDIDVVTQDSSPDGLVMNNTGTKLYMCGSSSSKVHEYDMV